MGAYFIPMAENKKSFLLYTDVHFTVQKLTNEQAGKLFKHILAYVNDENPVLDDLVLEIAFEPIKQSLKRDLRRYEEICKERTNAGRLGGLKSGEIRRTKSKANEANEANASKSKQTKQTQANEADNDSDNDNDIKKEKEIKKKKYADFVFLFPDEYKKLEFDHGEKNTQTFIDILNNYKGSSGKKYKSDFMTILNWVIDRAKKDGKYIDKASSKKPQMVW